MQLEEGEPISEFLEDFPTVNQEQVYAILHISQQLLMNVTKVAHENIA